MGIISTKLAVSNRWTGLWTGSVDCIGGLDCWTGLLDPTKLPAKAMMRMELPLKLKCSTVSVIINSSLSERSYCRTAR